MEVNSERREQTRRLFVPSSNIKVAYFEEIVPAATIDPIVANYCTHRGTPTIN